MGISRSHLPSSKPAASTVAALCLLLAACSDDDHTADVDADTAQGHVSELPAPETAIGSVTGMPANPGPGTTPITRGPTPGDQALAIDGDLTIDQAAPIDGVFVLNDAPLLPAPPEPPEPPAPQSPAEPRAAFVQPAESAPRPPPAGTEAATESTTFVVEPAEPDN